MKNLMLFDDYKDPIGSGSFNTVTEIDNDWVLKEPLDKKETALEPAVKGDKLTQKAVLAEFRRHISFMSKYPEFFAKVKRLSPNKAAIEKLDTNRSKEEIDKLHTFLASRVQWISEVETEDLLFWLYDTPKEVKRIQKKNYKDPIVKKWIDFLSNLIDRFHPMNLDITWYNVGIDKEGNIKLLDF